jgi:predicted flap endonuclease-1-like 5' DNA nuclease
MNVEDIEGIGSVYGEKLGGVGVKTVEDLLDAGAKPGGRDKLVASTGISHELILKWVNRADLYRVKGVGQEYSDLLEASGVDSPLELSHRIPQNLHAKLEQVNGEKKLVRRVPSLHEVEAWVAEAKSLPRVVEH